MLHCLPGRWRDQSDVHCHQHKRPVGIGAEVCTPGRCCDSWTASSEHQWGGAICHNAPVQPQHRLVSAGWGSYQEILHCKLGGGGEGGWGLEGGVLLRKTKGFKQKEGSEGGIRGVDGLTSAGHRCII